MREYKQAIILGAAPLGAEQKRLTGLLKWLGYMPPTAEELERAAATGCGGNCSHCKSTCGQNEIKKDVYLIAADGGIQFLFQHGIKPDYFVGDMDSLKLNENIDMESEKWKTYFAEIDKALVPVEKDDTDTALAVQKAYELGYRDILLYGGSGGKRVSHTFANVQLMCKYENLGCHIRMMADSYQAEILIDGKQTYSKALKGSVSVICLSDQATGVAIKGLKYEYEGNLTNNVALGVSNSFVGQEALIEVQKGILLLIYESEH